MHPLLTTKRAFFFYLLLWIPIGGLFALMMALASGLHWYEAVVVTIPLAFVYALICLGPWHSCRQLPSKPSGIIGMLINHLAAAAVASSVWTALARLWVTWLMRFLPNLGMKLQHQLPMVFVDGFLLYMLSVALHFTLFSIQNSKEAESRAQEARMLAREAELKALKSQINPHFLFNSLNSISALVTSDAKRAREMCIRLSEFLRSTLALGDKENIPLEEELRLAKAYLDVEQVRFGARLSVEQKVDIHCAGCIVPPLILQPLVENAVKHGVACLIDGGLVRIEAKCVDGFLRLRVENEFDADTPSSTRNGIGLVNVAGRLKARFQDQARMDTRAEQNFWIAEIMLPCATHAPESVEAAALPLEQAGAVSA